MQNQLPGILSLMTFLPLLGALIVMFLPRPTDLPEAHGDPDDHDAHDDSHSGSHDIAPTHSTPALPDLGRLLVNGVSLTFTILTFLISLALFGSFQSGYRNPHASGIAGNMQFIENLPWIHISGAHYVRYHMGVDGISLLLILLTTFLMVLCVLFSFRTKQRLKEFMVFLLLLETGMVGVFCALDLVLFYVFFEAMLIPMYFLIGIFGHENRIYAAIKFFIYTFAGSVLMLIAIVAIYSATGTFDLLALTSPYSSAALALQKVGPQALLWMFAAFALAFMIKVPMFPFHTWLPDAHVEAPTAGSVILAGVMLKMGTYGFIRICLPLFPAQARSLAPIFIVLAIIGIIYGSIVAAVQPDAKKLVAYSSVAHLGFVILGIFTFTRIGMMGALVQNINHGISTPMLFFIVGMLYDRRHTRQISEFGGLKKIVPMLATMLLIATLASIAVPFFNGFVGEFPVLLGSWISDVTGSMSEYWGMTGNFAHYAPTALAATGMILSAVYMLWWYQRLMLGPVTRPVNRRLPDLTRSEWAVLLPLAAVIFWFGIGSAYWTKRMDTSVDLLLPVSREALNGDLPISNLTGAQRANDRQSGDLPQLPARAPASGGQGSPGMTPPGGPQFGAPSGGRVPSMGFPGARRPGMRPRRRLFGAPSSGSPGGMRAPGGAQSGQGGASASPLIPPGEASRTPGTARLKGSNAKLQPATRMRSDRPGNSRNPGSGRAGIGRSATPGMEAHA